MMNDEFNPDELIDSQEVATGLLMESLIKVVDSVGENLPHTLRVKVAQTLAECKALYPEQDLGDGTVKPSMWSEERSRVTREREDYLRSIDWNGYDVEEND